MCGTYFYRIIIISVCQDKIMSIITILSGSKPHGIYPFVFKTDFPQKASSHRKKRTIQMTSKLFASFGSSSWTRTTSVCNINSIAPSSGLFHCVAAPPPRSLFRPPDAVAARSPASASGSQVRWFGFTEKKITKGYTFVYPFVIGRAEWFRCHL